MLDEMVIAANNWLTRARRVRVTPAQLLIIAPHCLQFNQCDVDLHPDLRACRRCGRCKCAELARLAERHGVAAVLAGGGSDAIAAARRPEVRVVIAVACLRELRAGVVSIFPKPVVAVRNQQPNGPCRNTDVILAEVEAAMVQLLGLPPAPPEPT